MREKKSRKQLFQFVALSLLSAVSVLVTANESNAALQCYSCHGQSTTAGNDIRPLDTPAGSLSSYRNISTGAVKGSHSKHVAATVDATQCTVCHNNDASYTSSHRTGVINFNSGVDYRKGAGTLTFTNQTSVPVLGSCNNASCHIAALDQVKVTPTWGDTATCNSCHDATPTTGKHTKHLSTAFHAVSCGDCHTGASTTSGGDNHLTGTISVASGLGYPTSTPKHTSGTYVGTCSTVYCHSSGQGTTVANNGLVATPVYAPVSWGQAPLDCGGCHAAPASMASGRHATHIGKDSNCGNCHTGATSTGYAATTHVDGNIDVAAGIGYTGAGAPGNGYGTCSNASCHNPFTDGTPKTTRAWGYTSIGCSDCHLATPTTGAHQKHNALTAVSALGCAYCHTDGGDPTHADGFVNVLQIASPVPKHASNNYTATCATACHNAYGTGTAPTPTWSQTAGCSACHTTPPTTGLHVKHKALATNDNCSQCHAGASLTSGGNTHGDGNVDVTQGYPTVVGKHASGSGYASCSTASCHDVYGTTGSSAIATPNWGATTTACTSCHTATITTGKHVEHVTTTSRTISCGTCHVGASTSNGGSNHVDGFVNVSAVGVAKRVLTKHAVGTGYTTCTTACHNAPGAVPAFTAPALAWNATVTCNSCHTSPPQNANHATKTGYVAANSCNGCHDEVATTGTTFTKPELHMNGKIDGGKCDACHGFPPVQKMTNELGAAFGVSGNYTSAKMQNYSGGGGVHAVKGHLALTTRITDGFGAAGSAAPGCATCHPSADPTVTHNQGAGVFQTANVQIVVDTQFKFDKNRPIVYNAVQSGTSKKSGTCANVACHFQKSPLWSTETYTKGH